MPPPNILIAHVRAASSGGVSIENTHPFIFNGVVLAHNGTVTGLPADRSGRAEGETDSELLALLVSDRMKEKGTLASAMKSVIREEVDGRSFTAAIMLASDGRTLVGYRDFTALDRSSYYSLKLARCEHSVRLFQELAVGCSGERSDIGKRELISVTPDLKVKTERL